MNPEELKLRSKQFGLRVIRLVQSLPKDSVGQVLSRQLLRSATSVGANYRAACNARSQSEFISKIMIVREEADESVYWIEMLVESRIIPEEKVADLLNEARELTAIFSASAKTAKRNKFRVAEPAITE